MQSSSHIDTRCRYIMILSRDSRRCTKKCLWQLQSLHLLEKSCQTRQTLTYHRTRFEWRYLKGKRQTDVKSSSRSYKAFQKSTNRKCCARWLLVDESICSQTLNSTCQAWQKRFKARSKKKYWQIRCRCLTVQLRRLNWTTLCHQRWEANETRVTRSTPVESITAQRSRML